MPLDDRTVAGAVAIVAVLAMVALPIATVDSVVTGADVVRIALGLCAISFAAVSTMYGLDGYREQAVGHGLASAGFGIVAIGTEGVLAWIGLGLLGVGSGLLLRDAHDRGGRGRTSS